MTQSSTQLHVQHYTDWPTVLACVEQFQVYNILAMFTFLSAYILSAL